MSAKTFFVFDENSEKNTILWGKSVQVENKFSTEKHSDLFILVVLLKKGGGVGIAFNHH